MNWSLQRAVKLVKTTLQPLNYQFMQKNYIRTLSHTYAHIPQSSTWLMAQFIDPTPRSK